MRSTRYSVREHVMKTQRTKNRRNMLVSLAALLAAVPVVANAGPVGNAGPVINNEDCRVLPLSDFLSAQGTSAQFFPPVRDYVGWSDGALRTFALVDYA